MNNTNNLNFTREKNGYDRAQVDRYIAKLSEAYQTTFDEHKDIRGKYEELLELLKSRNAQEQTAREMARQEALEMAQQAAEDATRQAARDTARQSARDSDIIAKTLINAETMAQKIISDSNDEAKKILGDAQREAQDETHKILSDAHIEAEYIRADAQKTARMITNDAITESNEAKEAAKQIINDANTEAVLIIAKARKNLEKARATMEDAAKETEKLLTFRIYDDENAVVNSSNYGQPYISDTR